MLNLAMNVKKIHLMCSVISDLLNIAKRKQHTYSPDLRIFQQAPDHSELIFTS